MDSPTDKVRIRLVVLELWDGPDDICTGLHCCMCDRHVYLPKVLPGEEDIIDGAKALCVECRPRLEASVPPGTVRRLGTG